MHNFGIVVTNSARARIFVAEDSNASRAPRVERERLFGQKIVRQAAVALPGL